jgi:hypothetical protein
LAPGTGVQSDLPSPREARTGKVQSVVDFHFSDRSDFCVTRRRIVAGSV